jgi:flagellar hook-associated protein 2
VAISGVSGVTTTTQSSKVVGTTFLDGLVSGLDTTSIIQQLSAIQSQSITRLTAQKATLQSKLEVYQKLNALLASAKLAADALCDPATLNVRQATVSGYTGTAAPVVVSASSDAQPGSYDLVVERLATAHKIASAPGSVSSATTALGLSGDILINGKVITVQAGDTLQDIRGKINGAGAGVTATIVSVGTGDNRLVLTSRSLGADGAIRLVDASASNVLQSLGLFTGAVSVKHPADEGRTVQSDSFHSSALTVAQQLGLFAPTSGTVSIAGVGIAVDLAQDSLTTIRDKINNSAELQAQGVTASIVTETVSGQTTYRLQITRAEGTLELTDDGNVLQTLGVLQGTLANELQAAQNSRIWLDGTAVERASNSLDDVIEGVSIELTQAAPGQTLKLTVSSDPSSVANSVGKFVDAYNAVIDHLRSAQQYDTDTQTGGLLFGDSVALNLEFGLPNAVTREVTALVGDPTLLSAIGISTDQKDHLVLDRTKLQLALQDNPEGVTNLFRGRTQASDSRVQVVEVGRQTGDSGNNGWQVHITQAPTRATATSRSFAPDATLSQDETLTFGDGLQVSLHAGMTLSEAAEALNDAFRSWGKPYEASMGTSGGQSYLQIQHEQYGSKYSVRVTSSLDQGAGGLDLGGAVAGEAKTYTGQDVAGTINGEFCVGAGQYLTGVDTNPNTAGLKLKITADTGNVDLGTVTVTKGAARRLSDYINFSLDPSTGAVTQGAAAINREMDAIDDEIAKVKERVQRYEDDLRAKFTAMESILGQKQALQQYITAQVSSMKKGSGAD